MRTIKESIDFIPNNENIFFHCRIAPLKKLDTYKGITLLLLNLLKKKKLKSLIVPTYTYSFTKKKIFNRSSSTSEVGRFSEEVRKICKTQQRSIDPIFSYIDVFSSGVVNNNIYNSSFHKDSIFEYWNKVNGIVVNYGLDELISTQLHYLEYKNKVPYRENKLFNGLIVNKNKKVDVKYKFFCRKDINNTFFDRKKILKDLLLKKLIKQKKFSDITVIWFKSRDVCDYLSKKIKKNKEYLLIK